MLAAALLVLFQAGCATIPDPFRDPQPQRAEKRVPARGAALIEQLLPQRLAERRGWAEDIHEAMSALGIEVELIVEVR